MVFRALPVDALESYEFFQIANTQSGGTSPLTGASQEIEMPGGRWGGRLIYSQLSEVEWRALQAFVFALGGAAGRFQFGPPYQDNTGVATAAGTPRIAEGGQTGIIVQTIGWAALTSNIVMPGDWICWNDPTGRPQLHMVVGDGAIPYNAAGSPSDADGRCSFTVWPAIRRPPTADTPLETWRRGIFKLSDPRSARMAFSQGMLGSITLDIEEALY
jgi:hypothetical protein